MVWDSAHYALSGRLLLDWLTELCHGHFQNPHDMELGYSILLDGLPMPLFACALTALAGLCRWNVTAVLLSGQSIISGLSGLMLYLLARKIGLSRRFSLGGAMAWAFYPGQIVNAGRFMTEPPAAFLLLAFVYLLSLLLPRRQTSTDQDEQNDQNDQNAPSDSSIADSPASHLFSLRSASTAFAAGLVLTVLVHVKTVFVPLAAALIALTLINIRPLKKALIHGIIMGAAAFIALVPWLAFTQITLHHRTMLPDRQSGYNLAMGVDTDYGGWATFPASPRLESCRDDAPMRTFIAACKDRPQKIACLTALKLERLFKNCWNDFYADALGLKRPAQTSLHGFLMLGAMLGLIYLLAAEKILNENVRRLTSSLFIKVAAPLVISFHLIYLPFEAQARYAFPTTPWLLLLFLIGLDHLRHTWHSRLAIFCACFTTLILLGERLDLAPLLVDKLGSIETATLTLELLFALTVALWLGACFQAARLKMGAAKTMGPTALVVGLSSLIIGGWYVLRSQVPMPYVWNIMLKSGETIERTVSIPDNAAKAWAERFSRGEGWAAIVVDGDENLSLAELKLNGKQLPALKSLIEEADKECKEPSESVIFKETARACGIKGATMRQWRISPVDPAYINFTGSNTIACKAAAPTMILGQYHQGKGRQILNLPDLWNFSFGQSTITGDIRPINCTMLAAAEITPTKQDLSPAPGLQTGHYRMHLLLGYNNLDLNSEHKSQERIIRHSFKQLF